jgi:nicotinamidase/pyrazinamidase
MSGHKYVFVDIDTQFDFMDAKGTLYVPQAEEITANLTQLTNYARQQQIPIVASVDAHSLDDPEFNQFPAHCVRDTPGQQKIAATQLPHSVTIGATAAPLPQNLQQVVLEKTIFSIFGNANAEAVFRQLAAEQYVVFGVATDYCVKAAVLGLLERGYRVAVVTDAIRGVTPAGSQAAIAAMQAAGAEFVTTKSLVSC